MSYAQYYSKLDNARIDSRQLIGLDRQEVRILYDKMIGNICKNGFYECMMNDDIDFYLIVDAIVADIYRMEDGFDSDVFNKIQDEVDVIYSKTYVFTKMNSDRKFFGNLFKSVFDAISGGISVGGGSGDSDDSDGGSDGGTFSEIVGYFVAGLLINKSEGQNPIINKSTGKVATCLELRNFIDDAYTRQMQK